ncbi:MAG TPA: hypothetical protein VJ302_07745 [Blastocatellia bacterium]|nr:hypothetical protein [Blastocatellia bacterium]
MRVKPNIALMVVIGLSQVLIAGGCKHHRRVEPQLNARDNGDNGVKIAPSDAGDGSEPALSIVDKGGDGVDLPEREEIRRVYKLQPGSRVSINGINGKIDVETADTETAEVFIVRSARKREDLQFRKIMIDRESRELEIRVENDRKSLFSTLGSIPEGRQRVLLRLPREIELNTHGLNGNLTVGEVDGKIKANGVNGEINIAQATGELIFHGVNGNIEATIAKLSGEGVDLSGVNGNTTLRFIGEVNAEVEANGMNGRVDADFQNLEVRKNEGFGRYSARIGNGGVQIEAHGVNGNLHLGKSEKTISAATKAPAKTKSATAK